MINWKKVGIISAAIIIPGGITGILAAYLYDRYKDKKCTPKKQ